ncbi:hypothetical protein PAXRUDRAFT_676657, partial [Paxillus rubicundulus Ve08.2h10]
EEQLGIFLYTCVTGLSSRHVGERFQHSPDTITKYFKWMLFFFFQARLSMALRCNFQQRTPQYHPVLLTIHASAFSMIALVLLMAPTFVPSPLLKTNRICTIGRDTSHKIV